MFKNLVIKKIVAAALLLVFAFSITPTIIFHNWLANHSDTVKKYTHTNGDQLGKKTFNCHCDNIVAESPFTQPAKEISNTPEAVFFIVNADKQLRFTTSPHIFYSLRGPPAV